MAEPKKLLPRLMLPPHPSQGMDGPSTDPPRVSIAGTAHDERPISATGSESSLDPELSRELFGTPLSADFPATAKQQQSGLEGNGRSEDHHRAVQQPQWDQAQMGAQVKHDSLLFHGKPAPVNGHAIGTFIDGASIAAGHDTLISSLPDVAAISETAEHSISTASDSKHTQSHGPLAQHAAAIATTRQEQLSSMPPPAAPASMLASITPSNRAKTHRETLTDPSILGRLVPAAVVLFRKGDAMMSKAIAQFTVDLVGKELWDEYLPIYQEAAEEPNDGDAVNGLLQEAIAIIRHYDQESAGFLNGMLS